MFPCRVLTDRDAFGQPTPARTARTHSPHAQHAGHAHAQHIDLLVVAFNLPHLRAPSEDEVSTRSDSWQVSVAMNAFVRQLEFQADAYSFDLGMELKKPLTKIATTNLGSAQLARFVRSRYCAGTFVDFAGVCECGLC